MNMVIDILAAIVLLFFFLSGWHKGLLLSLLGIVRVLLAYSAAYFAGRYVGYWLGEAVYRPRIVTIPVVAGFTFMLITFLFFILNSRIRAKHKEKEEKEEDYHRPLMSCLSGSVLNSIAGLLSLILLFWLGDLFMVGTTGTYIPGSDTAYFSRFARRTIFESARRIVPEKDNPSQAASLGRATIS